jgi:carboxyl-terminal processing protease
MSPRTRLLVALLSTALVGYIALGTLLGRALGDTSYGQLAVFNEVVRYVLDAYVEPVNLDRAMAGARLGMADALDGDSVYLDAEEFQRYRKTPMAAEADIGVVLTRRFAFLMVVAPRVDSPAARAGLRPGDVLRAIDGRHSRPLSTLAGARLLRGAPGSTVRLSVLRAGEDPFDLAVVRERLVASPPSGRMLEAETAYLKVPEFPDGVAEQVRSEVDRLRRAGATSLVLDLRGAAWGDAEEGVSVAELFLEGGAVAKLAGRRVEERTFTADPSRTAWKGPLAVLIDSGTAGAAEIVAGAILDASRGPLVGAHTFGRAAVQQAVPLPEGGLLLTVARYMSPAGKVIHGQGLEPTEPVAAPAERAEAAPADPALERALELLSTSLKKAA